jgi:hypothetical protein
MKMRSFEYKLDRALGLIEESSIQTFYKGMLLPNYEKFLTHGIPGFLADLDLALIYADPNTMGNEEIPRVIIIVDIDTSMIEDLRNEIKDMCGSWQTNPKCSGLRSRIWWSNSGGHGKRGIYCGQSMPHKVLFKSDTPEEFYMHVNSPRIQKMLSKYDHLYNSEDTMWSDFN